METGRDQPLEPLPDESSDDAQEAERDADLTWFGRTLRSEKGASAPAAGSEPLDGSGEIPRFAGRSDEAPGIGDGPIDDGVPPAEVPTDDEKPRIEDLGRRAWAIVGIVLVIALCVWVLTIISWLLAPAVVTAILAVFAAPIVARLAPSGRRRTVATAGVFIAMVIVVGICVWLIGPAFARQIARLTIDVPEVTEDLASRLDDFAARIEGASPAAAGAIEQFQESLVERSEEFGSDLAGSIFGIVGSVLGFMAAIIIGAVIGFMVVKDLPSLTSRMRRWMDRPENRRGRGVLLGTGRSTTGFVRGQLVVAIVVGVLKTIALWLLGIPYFIPLGILQGVGNLVPGIGPVLVAIPPILIALASGGWWLALGVAIALIVVQLVDIWWFSPMFVGSKIRLPTLVVIVAMIIGAGLFGFAGLIIAVPVAAAVRESVHWVLLSDDDVDTELADLESAESSPRSAGRVRRRTTRANRTVRRPEERASERSDQESSETVDGA